VTNCLSHDTTVIICLKEREKELLWMSGLKHIMDQLLHILLLPFV
jgi:hypothetical protein